MKVRNDCISGFIVMLVVVAMGCSPSETTGPHIRYGEETCDRCRMIISEKRFAAAYRTDTDAMRKFDDLGCAVLHRIEQREQVQVFWTHDYKEGSWLDTAEAFFVRSADLSTPMGYGIVAVKTETEADLLAKETQGQIVQFNQLQHLLQR